MIYGKIGMGTVNFPFHPAIVRQFLGFMELNAETVFPPQTDSRNAIAYRRVVGSVL